jgi:hypothetical protein
MDTTGKFFNAEDGLGGPRWFQMVPEIARIV